MAGLPIDFRMSTKGRPAELMDLAEIKARVSAIAERHAKFYDAGRHIEAECEICWFIKTIKDGVGGGSSQLDVKT